jgi:enamine deaminase RidA (YjgF/YER057c/UK114 family)
LEIAMTMLLTPVEPLLMTVQPSGWPQPSGLAHTVVGSGTFVLVGGQIATDETGSVMSVGLVAQALQALRNIRVILAEIGARPEHIAQMTWFVLNMNHYRARLKELGAAYRDVMGFHYPAVALVEVSALAHPDAIVEITAKVILPESRQSLG